MAPPCYASTEWVGLGHATLRFRPKRGSTHPGEVHQINCYLSAVYIGEYGEKKQAVKENETRELESDLKPPGIPPELWTAWQEYWEAWKEVLIPLSWVHKYRNHCTPEYIKWHDSYLEDYPEVLPLITDELGRSELSEDTTNQFLKNETCQSNRKFDLIASGEEEEQDNQNGSAFQETVSGEAGTDMEKGCESDEQKRNEFNRSATKQSSGKNPQSIDELDLSEFYDYIYCGETTETSQNYHKEETGKRDVAAASLQQDCASEGTAGVNNAADTTIEKSEEKRIKVLDELYEKHIKSRYWVHLRSFLHISGTEYDPEIESFFEKEAGIKFVIHSSAESRSSVSKDTEELSCVAYSGSCAVKGDDQPEEKHILGRSELPFEEKENHTSTNCNEHESDFSHESSLHGKTNDNKGRRKQMKEAKQKTEGDSAETPTSKGLHDSSCVPQKAGGCNSGKEKLNGDTSSEGNTKMESGRMEVEGASSIDDEGENVQAIESATMICASSSLNNKQKMSKKKRKRDTARPQGLTWALKYVQEKESKQTEEIKGISETGSIFHELQEVVPKSPGTSPGSHEAASVSSKAALGFPEAFPGSLEAAPESHEVAHGFHKAASKSSKAVLGVSETAPGFPEAAHGLSMPAAGSSEVTHSDTDEEDSGIRHFLDLLYESQVQYEKNYFRMLDEKALRETLQKPTGLARLKAACQATMDRAAAALKELLLPLTAMHLLNLSFPGSAAIEYESSVTEEVPGEREKLKFQFHCFVYEKKVRLMPYLTKLGRFCLTMWRDAVMPLSFHHMTNLVFQNALEIEHMFPSTIFGVRWLPEPESSLHGAGKNVKRCQRRLHRWLEIHDPNLSPSATVKLRGMVMNRMNYADQDPRKSQQLYQQIVMGDKEGRTNHGCHSLTLHTLHLLQESSKTGVCGGTEGVEVEWTRMGVPFDDNGYFDIANTGITSQSTEDAKAEAEAEMWQRIISGCRRLTFWETDNSMPPHLPREILKYWAQRYRLFLKYDEGIELDTESWYSVTPELLAAHQARRCKCEVVVDALCGAGGNAIQLAKTCSHVIAIDKDPNKVNLARHNAEVYGVAHRIDFRVGNFFKLAPFLKADVVYLSPPWGGMEYQEECVYDVYSLGGTMNCAHLLRAARAISPNVALYLPRNSNLCQVIALAGVDGVVDIEANYMGPKKKSITAYFGNLATKTGFS